MRFLRQTTTNLSIFGGFKQYLYGMKRDIDKPDYRSMDEVKLTIQQFSDQERNRLDWRSNYDIRHFKKVLLKEAADRPEGVSLENALLQRCRDYFEDIADEILDRVGISDIDLYLEALKNRIDKSDSDCQIFSANLHTFALTKNKTLWQ